MPQRPLQRRLHLHIDIAKLVDREVEVFPPLPWRERAGVRVRPPLPKPCRSYRRIFVLSGSQSHSSNRRPSQRATSRMHHRIWRPLGSLGHRTDSAWCRPSKEPALARRWSLSRS